MDKAIIRVSVGSEYNLEPVSNVRNCFFLSSCCCLIAWLVQPIPSVGSSGVIIHADSACTCSENLHIVVVVRDGPLLYLLLRFM